MRPAQTRETGEVVVERHPAGIVLDIEGRVLGVGDKIAPGVALSAEPIHDVPAPGPGCHPDNSFGAAEGGNVVEGRPERSGDREDPRVGQDPDHPAQHGVGHREQFGAGDDVLEPVAQPGEPIGIGAKRSDQDVDIGLIT